MEQDLYALSIRGPHFECVISILRARCPQGAVFRMNSALSCIGHGFLRTERHTLSTRFSDISFISRASLFSPIRPRTDGPRSSFFLSKRMRLDVRHPVNPLGLGEDACIFKPLVSRVHQSMFNSLQPKKKCRPQMASTTDLKATQASTPFEFKSAAHLLFIERERATNIDELLRALQTCPEESIFQHTFRTLEEHHFIKEGFSNDFAHWAYSELGEVGLGERLASLDVREFTSLTALRERLVQIVEDFSAERPTARG